MACFKLNASNVKFKTFLSKSIEIFLSLEIGLLFEVMLLPGRFLD